MTTLWFCFKTETTLPLPKSEESGVCLWISSAWQQVFICSVFSSCHRSVSLASLQPPPSGALLSSRDHRAVGAVGRNPPPHATSP